MCCHKALLPSGCDIKLVCTETVPAILPVTQAREPGPQNSIPEMNNIHNCNRDVKHVVDSTFPQVDISRVHHYDLCQEKTNCNMSGSSFKREWLSLNKNSDRK